MKKYFLLILTSMPFLLSYSSIAIETQEREWPHAGHSKNDPLNSESAKIKEEIVHYFKPISTADLKKAFECYQIITKNENHGTKQTQFGLVSPASLEIKGNILNGSLLRIHAPNAKNADYTITNSDFEISDMPQTSDAELNSARTFKFSNAVLKSLARNPANKFKTNNVALNLEEANTAEKFNVFTDWLGKEIAYLMKTKNRFPGITSLCPSSALVKAAEIAKSTQPEAPHAFTAIEKYFGLDRKW